MSDTKSQSGQTGRGPCQGNCEILKHTFQMTTGIVCGTIMLGATAPGDLVPGWEVPQGAFVLGSSMWCYEASGAAFDRSWSTGVDR